MTSRDLPNTSGIYRITCITTEKIYIGSAVSLSRRWNEHRSQLRYGKHKNLKMQAAWNKYGEQSFIFEVIELVLIPELLTAREQYWFGQLKPFGKNGFNIERVAGSPLGRKHTPDAIEKIRASSLGRKFPPEFGANISKRQIGRMLSTETRKKIGDAQRGKPRPDLRGRTIPPEQIERQRRSLTGYKHTEEAKRNMGESHRGTKRSAETREKMRLAALGHAPTNAKAFILTSPDGVEYIVTNGLPGFCREHNLNSSTLIQVAKGNRVHHKGWIACYYTPKENAG